MRRTEALREIVPTPVMIPLCEMGLQATEELSVVHVVQLSGQCE